MTTHEEASLPEVEILSEFPTKKGKPEKTTAPDSEELNEEVEDVPEDIKSGAEPPAEAGVKPGVYSTKEDAAAEEESADGELDVPEKDDEPPITVKKHETTESTDEDVEEEAESDE